MKEFQKINLIAWGQKLRLEAVWRKTHVVTIRMIAKTFLPKKKWRVFKAAFDTAKPWMQNGLIDLHTKSFQKMCQTISSKISALFNSGFGRAGPAGLDGATPAALAALGFQPEQPTKSLLWMFGTTHGGDPKYLVSSPERTLI